MSKIARVERRIELVAPVVIFIIVAVIWFAYYSMGFSYFNKNNAVSMFGSVIQGMSALLSVAIAVIVFRIQSLENRNGSLEQSTLNYIFQTTGVIYPQWLPSVEDDIRSKGLTNRYYSNRLTLSKEGLLTRTQQELEKDRDEQQKRLEETLNLHARIEQTIQRIRRGVFSSVVFLMLPILFSFLLLMVSDALDPSYNFVFVSIVVLMSTTGIAILIRIVLESTVQAHSSG